jgi:hypothetical protein
MDVGETVDRALALRALLEAGRREEAHDFAAAWREADPQGLVALGAQAELAAASGDWKSAREALAAYVAAARAAGPVQDIPSRFIHDDDTRLRMLQLWLSHEGENRSSLRRMVEHLERFPFFIPPAPTGVTDAQFAAANAERLKRHETLHAAAASEMTLWRTWTDPSDLQNFRSEVFMSQVASHDPSNYGAEALLRAYERALAYARSVDALGCLTRFDDRGAYGGMRFRSSDGTIVSRDILDSTLELNFLARYFALEDLLTATVVDIGAGYGRFIARFLDMFHSSRALALDVTPLASFAAETYLTYLGAMERCTIGGRGALAEATLSGLVIACNIHSWSEAPLASIEAWLDALDQRSAPFLFLVTHDARADSWEHDGSRKPFLPAIEERGYSCVADQPQYGWGDEGREALYPSSHYRLFARDRALRRRRRRKGAAPPPLWNRPFESKRRLVFLHVPKTAGTSFTEALAASLERTRGPLQFDHYHFGGLTTLDVLEPAQRALVIGKDEPVEDEARFVAGHFSLSTLKRAYAGAQLITLLREPRSRVLSYWMFGRAARDETLPPWGPEWTERMLLMRGPFADFVSHPKLLAQSDNVVARMLLRPHPLIEDEAPIDERHDGVVLAEALARLDDLAFVDVVENPLLVENVAAWLGCAVTMRRLNESAAVPEPLRRPIDAELAPDVLELLAARTRLDLAIWSYVAARRLPERPLEAVLERAFQGAVDRYRRVMA